MNVESKLGDSSLAAKNDRRAASRLDKKAHPDISIEAPSDVLRTLHGHAGAGAMPREGH